MTLTDIKTIRFYPCTGFGSAGRGAVFDLADGSSFHGGYGATDEEAILESLVYADWTFDAAFDAVGDVNRLIRTGAIRVVRD